MHRLPVADPGHTKIRYSICGLLASCLITSLLVACSSGSGLGQAAQALPASAAPSQSFTSPSETANPPDPSTDSFPTETPDPTDGSDGSQPSSGPPILGSGDTGRPLTLADVFAKSDGWRDDRFDIASKTGLTGMGSIVTSCYENNPVTMELRLAEGFTKLTMNVGQANDSQSSDQSLVTQVIANGKQVDSHHIPFNTIQPFNVSVAGVNALIVEMYLDPDQCSKSRTSPSVLAVIQGLTVY